MLSDFIDVVWSNILELLSLEVACRLLHGFWENFDGFCGSSSWAPPSGASYCCGSWVHFVQGKVQQMLGLQLVFHWTLSFASQCDLEPMLFHVYFPCGFVSEAWHFGPLLNHVFFSLSGQRCTAWSTCFSACMVWSLLVGDLTYCGKPSAWILRILDFVPSKGNPRFYQCLLDEDMIRRALWLHVCLPWCMHVWRFIWPALIFIKVKAIVQYIHPNVFASRALQHYCVAICMRWVRGVHMRDDLDWNGKSVKRGFCDFPFFPSGLMLTHLFSSGPLLTQAQERFKNGVLCGQGVLYGQVSRWGCYVAL